MFVSSHSDVAVHVVKEKVESKGTDDQVKARMCELNHFDSILRQRAGIGSDINTIFWEIDQREPRRVAHGPDVLKGWQRWDRIGSRIDGVPDILGLCAGTVHGDLV